MAHAPADGKDVVGVFVDVDNVDSNGDQDRGIDGIDSPEAQSTTGVAAIECSTKCTTPESGIQAEKTNQCHAQSPMEKVEAPNRLGVSSYKQEHLGERRGGQKRGMFDKTQAATWDSNGWSSWRHTWARLVLAIIKWAASWNKGHGDEATTISMTLACYRSNQGGNTGTSDGNGKCDNTMTTHSDARRGVTKAQGDTSAPERKDVATEQQQRMLDTEVAQYTRVNEAKTNALTSYTGGMLHIQSETMVHKGAGNTEQYNVKSDIFKSREGDSPEAAGEVIEIHDERLGKRAAANRDEREMEIQMDFIGDYNENMDDVDNDCNQAGDIDGRLWNDTQKSMVDTDCRNNVTQLERTTKAEVLHEGSDQSGTAETETHSGRLCMEAKPAQVSCEAQWLVHKTLVTTRAFMWWRAWKRVWTRVVSLFFMEWVLKWEKGHGGGDRGTYVSNKSTSDRRYHGGNGYDESSGYWDAVSATGNTGVNKLVMTSAHRDTKASKTNDAAMEHQHGKPDTEKADTGIKRGKRKGRNRSARSTSYKKYVAPKAYSEKEEHDNTRSGKDKDGGNDSHTIEEKAEDTTSEDPCEQVSEHAHKGEEQMACARLTLDDTGHTREQTTIPTRRTNTTHEQETRASGAQADTGLLRKQRAHSKAGGDVDETSDGDSSIVEEETSDAQVEGSGKHVSESEGECGDPTDTEDLREQRARRTHWGNVTRHCLNRWIQVTRTNEGSEDGTRWETVRHVARNNAKRRARKAEVRAAQEEMASETGATEHHSGHWSYGDKGTSGTASSQTEGGDIIHSELEVEKDARRVKFLRESHETLRASLGHHDALVKEIEARICRVEIRKLKHSIAGLEDKLRKGDQTSVGCTRRTYNTWV